MKLKSLLLSALLALSWPAANALAAAEENPVQAETSQGIEITVNVNSASAEEIATLLSGIGLKKAQAIVDYRQANGQFQTKQDLTKVKGIGEATVAKNEARILL
ncbi:MULTISPECIES: ComEA family DNA-binding protein [Vibrio]|uniref:ComEA family DNA-binding protein n=1 Tax=Vibrio ostreae TaxID=2841925 RepID=A0A975UE87_9VIBR|nr:MULTISPECIES: ComEA family DNA-binding protein [Vibrio]QXO19121.1 ComEA family DNA-binding protein [Vibrio ostreae]WGY46530.1 ComEA family DNA-binding protein [Vibrio sp. ABG19]